MTVSARHNIVFLDHATLPVAVPRPACTASWQDYDASTPDQVLPRLRDATVAISNKVPLPATVLRALPRLKLIAIAATGYDMVDLACCRELGIAVCNIRDYAVHSVPEHVFMLALALRRQLLAYHEQVRQGAWQIAGSFCLPGPVLRDLHGAVLGVVGRGSLGQATAQIGRGFGMRVIFARHGVRRTGADDDLPLDELLAVADILTLHCPLNDSTRGLIGRTQLQRMKRDALLINTARGGLVDEAALVEALEQGWIGGAGFDVLTTEPPREGNPLLALQRPNLIVTPHVAWASREAQETLAAQLSGNIDAWDQGRPRNLVT